MLFAATSQLKLRRSFAFVPHSIDEWMKKKELDMASPSNTDIKTTTELLKTQKYRHPLARQMAAAARYGWYVSPDHAAFPENWKNAIYYCSAGNNEISVQN